MQHEDLCNIGVLYIILRGNSTTHVHTYVIVTLFFSIAMHEHLPIFTYILEPMYMMVWRCGGTYSWIYWRTKEMNIRDFFLSI